MRDLQIELSASMMLQPELTELNRLPARATLQAFAAQQSYAAQKGASQKVATQKRSKNSWRLSLNANR